MARLRRFLKAEKELAVEDETMGGQQDNTMLGLHKQVGAEMGKMCGGVGNQMTEAWCCCDTSGNVCALERQHLMFKGVKQKLI